MNYMSIPGTAYIPKTGQIVSDHHKLFHSVCKTFKVEPNVILDSGRCRKRDFVIVKQVTMTLFKLRTNLSLTAIGNYFERDHATTLHSIKTVKNLIDTDRIFREQTSELFAGLHWPYLKN